MTDDDAPRYWSRAVETNAIAWGFVGRGGGSEVESGRLIVNVDGSIKVEVVDDYYTGTIDPAAAAGLLRVLQMRLHADHH